MIEFFQAGGVAMFAILAFGMMTLVAGGMSAFAPSERKLAFIRAMTVSTTFATISGTVAAIGAVMKQVPARPEWAQSPELHLIVMTGLGESMAPPVLGFSLLSLAWLLTAVGVRRAVI